MSETHPNAYKMEAAELRDQANVLLARAAALDPPAAEKPKAPPRKPAPRKRAASKGAKKK